MLFSKIVGQDFIKKHLTQSADKGRIPHAQLFVGKNGTGTLPMAIAYGRYILCANSDGENMGSNQACNLKFEQLAHPDLHFVYPVATTTSVKSHAVSSHFATEWRQFIKEKPYGDLYDWHVHLDIEKKQAKIGKDEAQDISKVLALKAYEGGYKVMIIWMADKMNTTAANKLLKLIEEPPSKTLFILITDNEDAIIDTIKSRCQILNFPLLSENQIAQALSENHSIDPGKAHKIAHQSEGDFGQALKLITTENNDVAFEKWLVSWVRNAFMVKSNKESVIDLLKWSESIAKTGRETQKNFLDYCIRFYRQALLSNYQIQELVYLETSSDFDLKKFAPFVHGNNILDIIQALEEASYHIERNGNARIILSDLSLKMTRFIHRK